MKQIITIFTLILTLFSNVLFAQEKKLLNDLKNLKEGEYILKKGDERSCSPGDVKIRDENLFIGANTAFVNINNGKIIDADEGESLSKKCRYETIVTTQLDKVLQKQEYYCGSTLIYTSDVTLTINNETLDVKQVDHWIETQKYVESLCEYSLKKVSQLKRAPEASNRVPARSE